MKKEQLKEITDNSINNLLDAIEQGKSEKLKTFLAFAGKFHNYSLRNQMLIFMQKRDCSRVAGYGTWKKFNRYVNKGEKGICILAPLGAKDKETGEFEVYGFKGVYVFDVSQTSGDKLPEYKSDYIGSTNIDMDKIIESFNIKLKYDNLNGSDGKSSIGTITIDKDLDDSKSFVVKCHELGHELLHTKDERRNLTLKQKETEAEAIAFIVSSYAGIKSDTNFSDYILSHKGDKKTIMDSLSRIKKISNEIINKIEASK